MRPLRIRLLGGFDLQHGDDRVPLDSPRLQSLLGYLVLHRDVPQTRQRIAFLFWPDSTETQARTNLRNLLHQLRRALPAVEGHLDVGHRALSWRPDAEVWSDVTAFEEAADRGEQQSGPAAIDALQEAAGVYRGDLLPGCYEEWLLPEQERLRSRYGTVLERLFALYNQAGDSEREIAIGERLLRHDPFREDTHRCVILAHAARGDRSRALRAYHACAAILERELGVAPDAATRSAYERALGLAGTPPTLPVAAAGRGLVGRDQEWRALLNAWKASVAGRVQLVLISGEAGIGKTRLVEELLRWIGQQDYPTAQARSYSAEGELAYAPVIEWLRSAALGPALARLGEPARAELSRLAHRSADGDPPVGVSEAERRHRIYQAALQAMQGTERALTLVADDLQWCDRETIELLKYLVRRCERPLLVVGTLRREEIDAAHPLSDLGPALTAVGRFHEIELARLDATATAAMGGDATGRPLEALEATWLYRETEGNPLFIIETLRTDWTARAGRKGSPGPGNSGITPRVLALVETRLRQLSPDARHLAELAATIGREFSLSLLAKVERVGEEQLVQGLDELWRRRIIRERGSDEYDFSHDKIREAAYHGLSPVRRRERHLSVARALETMRGADPAVSGQLAWHFDLGGRPDEAIAWYQRAAGIAQQVSALEVATRALRRALELLERLPPSSERDERELHLLLALGSALVRMEGYAGRENREAYERARGLCTRLGFPAPAPVLRALALASIARNELEVTEALGKELLSAGRTQGDDVVEVEGLYLLGVTAFWHGRLPVAAEFLEEAIARYRPERHREHVALYAQDPKVVCLSRLAWTRWHLGFPERAAAIRDESLALAERLQDPYSRAYALWWALFPAVDAGDVRLVREHVAAMQSVAEEYNLLYIAAVVESFAGYRDTLDGAVAGGIARMETALSDPRAAGQEFVLRPQTLLLLAHAHGAAGHFDQALQAAAAGLDFARRGGRIWLGEFHRLEGELLASRQGDDTAIEAAFRRALGVAREQRSAWIELRAATGLARLRLRQGTIQRAEARAELEAAYARFAEGFDLPALREARGLLEELA